MRLAMPRASRTAFRFEQGDSRIMMGRLRWWVSQQLAQSAPERAEPAIVRCSERIWR
jgi:hypothetical protein